MYSSRGGDKNYAMRMPSNATWSKLDMEKHATDICKIPLHEAGFLLDSNQGTVKQSKIEDAKEIADMRVLWIANTGKYASRFRGARPFEGFGLPGDGLIVKSKRDSTTYHHANTSSNGINIMLVVLRQHLSFSLDLCIPQDKITDEEAEVYKVAWMNLGENKIHDWDIKRKLFKSVHGISDLQFNGIMEKKFSFEDVLAHPKLQNLFRGAHFDIASHIMLRKYPDEPDPAWARAIAEPDFLHLFNELRWDGVKKLDAFIDRHFKTVGYGNEHRIFFAAKPWFFKVLYEPHMIMRSIFELRNFQMGGIVTRELKDTDGKVIYNREKHVYALCAVVRLGNGNDVQDDPTPLPEDYFDDGAPDFEPRYSWATSDVDVTDTDQQNRSALEKTSSSTLKSSSNREQFGFRSGLSDFGPSKDGRIPMFGSISPMPMFGPRQDSELPWFGSTFQAPKFGSSTQASVSGSRSQESAINARTPPRMTPTPSSAGTHSSRNPRKRDHDGMMYDDADDGENNDSYQSSKSDGRSARLRTGEYCNFCRKTGHDERDCYKKNAALSSTRGTSNRRGNHSQCRGRGSLGGGFWSANEGVGSSTEQNRGDQGPHSGEYDSNRYQWVWRYG
ncbi:uncharacterized protein EAE97_004004 [Botrytis byssoidea]|uniref:CCHC-type domain-containing protein n=1 Tax=Botrytis byssoidea TaxID=139641 RepID=A0A9P5IWD3_9HELO|nr:uncharacterized protein EAE97_004004 [Botrytis byssoidea]KAF7948593.1 hypothetical protein EAE97_004004 [Botrytis byssoidea]